MRPCGLLETVEGLVVGDCDDGLVLVPGLMELDGSPELGDIGAVVVEEAEVVDSGDVEGVGSMITHRGARPGRSRRRRRRQQR